MTSFFREMGRGIERRWRKRNYGLAIFPELVGEEVEKRLEAGAFNLAELAAFERDFLMRDEQPVQTGSGFGEPELIVFEHPAFYIQLLYWLEGTTAIHQHEFSGIFHVLQGSSLHTEFDFLERREVTPTFHVGRLEARKMELLERGRTRMIRSGRKDIHSLFHLDTPSITLVVRTQHDPGTGPQFNYLPPHVALDPTREDWLTRRRCQLLDVMERTGAEGYLDLVMKLLGGLDFERGFAILQNCLGYLQECGGWEQAWEVFSRRHGELAAGIPSTLETMVRRETIKQLRAGITDPEHRFFLALLMNGASRSELETMVGRRFPATTPGETLLRWVEELLEETPAGYYVLDAVLTAPIFRRTPREQLCAGLRELIGGMTGEAKPVSPALRRALAVALTETGLAVLLRPAEGRVNKIF